MNKARLRKMKGVAMLSAVAFVLQIMEMPMPFSPPFARLDLSDLPALIGSFAYGYHSSQCFCIKGYRRF